MPRKKATAIIAYLSLQLRTRHRAARDSLAALLWPDSSQSGARQALRTTIAGIRKVFPEGVLRSERDWIELCGMVQCDPGIEATEPSVVVDVGCYQSLVKSIRPAVLTGAESPTREESSAAVAAAGLYAGDFLSGFFLRHCVEFEAWQASMCHQLQRTQTELLWLLCQAAVDEDRPAVAVGWAQQLSALDPCNEEVHRELMLLYHECGDTDASIAQFEICRLSVQTEENREPEQLTIDLFERLRRQPGVARSIEHVATVPGPDAASNTVPQPLPAQSPRIRVATLSAIAINLTETDIDIRDDRLLTMQSELRRHGEAIAADTGGIILPSGPDVIMLAFGANPGYEDDTERAVSAADLLLRKASQLELGACGAVRTGVVAVDDSGAMAGTPVTLIARQLANTPLGTVSLCEATERMLGEAATIEQIADGMPAWLGWLDPGRVFERAPFVGRSGELEQLIDSLRRTSAGEGLLVTVSGPAGIGKTHLIAEANRRAGDLDLEWVVAKCSERAATKSYDLLSVIVRQLLSLGCDRAWDDGLPAEAIRQMMATGVLAGAHVTAVQSVFDRLLSSEADSQGFGTADASQFEHDVRTALRAVFAILRTHHVVVLVEDLQWADALSRAVLDGFVGICNEQSITFVVTCRARSSVGVGTSLEPLKRALETEGVHLELREFSDRESAEYLRSLLPYDPERVSLDTELLSRAGGNPLFIRELASLIADSSASASDVPVTVHLVVQRRLDRLTASVRRAITIAAVIGSRFDIVVLERAEERLQEKVDEAKVADRIAWAAMANQVDGRVYEFSHVVVQEAIYSSLTRRELGRYHQAVGEVMEELVGEDAAITSADLALHFGHGDDLRKSAFYLELSGDDLRRVYDADGAIGCYTQAVEKVEQIGDSAWERRLYLKLAGCHSLDLRFHDGREAYRRAFQFAETMPRQGNRDMELRIGSDISKLGLHPIAQFDIHASLIHRQLYRPLVRFTSDLTAVPDAAESFNVSEDGRRYVFLLRDDVTWSDGEPLVADDFVAAIEGRGMEKHWRGSHLVSRDQDGWVTLDRSILERARAQDPRRLEIEFRYPTPYALQHLGQSIVAGLPSRRLGELGLEWHDPERCPASGAFKVTSWEHDTFIRLGPNPGYGSAFPGNVSVVEFQHYEQGSGIELFLDGTVDVLTHLTADDAHRAATQCSDSFVATPQNERGSVILSSEHPALQIVDVRQAFALSVDRHSIANEILHGLVVPAEGGTISPAQQGHSPTGGFGFDPDRARALAAEALGVGELRKAEFRAIARRIHEPEARFMAETWERVLGVTIKLDILGRREYLEQAVALDRPDIVIGYTRRSELDPLPSVGPGILDAMVGSATSPGADDIPTAVATIPRGAAEYLVALRSLDLRHVHQAWSFPFCYRPFYSLQRPWVRNLRLTPEGMMGLEETVVVNH